MQRLFEITQELTKDKISKILSILDDKADKDLWMEVAETAMDGHLCEGTALNKVEKMKPVILFSDIDARWECKEEFPMTQYMETIGLTAPRCHEMVLKAYEIAKDKASGFGVNAPNLPSGITPWDCYWSMAMMNADYWYTLLGNQEKASMMAYEYLSNPDK